MIEIREILYQWCQGKGKKAIARSLGIARNTVREIINQAQGLGLNREAGLAAHEMIAIKLIAMRRQKSAKTGSIQSRLGQHHDQIKAWLEVPDITVTQMIRLFAEQSFLLSETSLRTYIKRHLPTPTSTTVHLETIPGRQAQVDFGYVGRMIDPASAKARKCYVFIMALSHSRHRFIRFVFQQDTETWIDCHIRAFHFFGGVPETILLDNLKSGVIKPDIYDPTINRAYAELERYYGFVADPAKVRQPQHKGKVERSVTIVRQQLIAGRTYRDIYEANECAWQWCRYDIAQRITRTTGEEPWVRFIRDDKPALKALPAKDFERPIWQAATVHRDHHLVFKGSFYSVPSTHVEKPVWVRATLRLVQVYTDGKLIKEHPRTLKKGQWITDQQDYPKSVRKYFRQTPEMCQQEAKVMGTATGQMIQQILSQPTQTALRKAQAVLRLAKAHSAVCLEKSCRHALLFENYEYKSLKRILVKKLYEMPQDDGIYVKAINPDCAYLRPASAFTHTSQEDH